MPDNVVDTLRVRVEETAGNDTKEIGRLIGALTKLKTTIEPLQSMKLHSFFTPAAAKNASAFATAIDAIDIQKLKDLASLDLSNLSTAMSVGGMKDYSESLGNIEDGLKQLYYMLHDKFAPAQEKVAQSTAKATTAIRSQAKAAKSHHKSFNLANTSLGKFFNSIKRIAFYRIIRGAIKAVTQGFAEGIENMYFWSQAVGTSFAPAMDRLATATLYLKNGFASMWSPLIEKAIPIIDHLIDKVVDFFNLVQEGFAKLTGAATWTKALRYPVQFAENTEGATKAAKALQNVLMGFDELNVINTPNDSGRGAAADAKDYSAMFTSVKTVGSINWNNLARKVGQGFNKIIQPIHDFVDRTDFKTWGHNLSKNLRDGFDQIDFKMLGETLVGAFTGALDIFIGFVTEDPEGWATSLLTKTIDFVTGAFNKLNDWFKQQEFGDIIARLIEGISTAIVNAPWEDLTETFIGTVSSVLLSLPDVAMGLVEGSMGALAAAMERNGNYGGARKVREAQTKVSKARSEYKAWSKDIQEGVDGYAKEIRDATKSTRKVNAAQTKYNESVWQLGNIKNVFTDGALEEELENVAKSVTKTGDTTNTFTKQTERDLGDTMPRVFKRFAEEAGLDTTYAGNSVYSFSQRAGKSFGDVESALESGNDAFNTTTKSIADNMTYLGNSSAEMARRYALKQKEMQNESNKTASTAEAASGRVSSANTNMTTSTQNMATAIQKSLSKVQSQYNGLTFPKKTMTVEVMYKALVSSESVFSTPAANGFTSAIARNSLEKLLQNAPNATNISWKATGGYISPGELFYAGEGGIPEIMGKVNGRSAVVGGAEITGISDTIRAQGAREEQLLQAIYDALVAKDFSFVPNAASGRLINQALRQYSGVTG